MSAKIAVVQMWSTRDKAENLEQMERLVREAAANGARLVALPEIFTYIGLDSGSRENAEDIPGPTVDKLSKLARELSVTIHGGSLFEKAADGRRVHNTSVVVAPDCDIIGKYRKLHLSDIRLSGNATVVAEPEMVIGGDDIITIDSEVGKLGLSICFDMRFPELYRLLTLQGAEIVFVPSAFTMFTGKDHWETLLQARAIENQVHVVAAGQMGVRSANEAFYGRSVVIDPWGVVVSKARDKVGVIYADIDLDQQRELRNNLPSLKCRREDVYSLKAASPR